MAHSCVGASQVRPLGHLRSAAPVRLFRALSSLRKSSVPPLEQGSDELDQRPLSAGGRLRGRCGLRRLFGRAGPLLAPECTAYKFSE